MNLDVLQNKIISTGKFEKERQYWLDKLAGELLVSSFPYDFPQSQACTGKRETYTCDFPVSVYKTLQDISNGSPYGMYMILLTGVFYLLHRYSGNTDIIIGAPVFRQESQGMYLNDILVLRNEVSTNMAFRDLLLQVRDTVNEANENMNFPVNKIIESLNLHNSGEKSALFDVLVVLKNVHDQSYVRYHEQYSILFGFNMTDQTLEFTVEYNSNLFKRTTVSQLCSHFINCLINVSQNSSKKLSDIEILSQEEILRIVGGFNNTETSYPKDKTIQQLFEEQVDRTPDAVAVSFEGEELTYRELNEKSNQIACLLKEAGVKPGDTVGLLSARTLEMIVGIIGIIKANAACLPIDTKYPVERISFILQDSNTQVLLTSEDFGSKVQFDGQVISINQEKLASYETDNSESLQTSDSPAYIIYTSGTTGQPKGVVLKHVGINNHTFTKIKELGLNSDDIVCHNLSINFVASIWQVFAPLFLGAKLIIYPEDIISNAYKLFQRVDIDRVTVLEVVPTLLRAYLELLDERKEKLGLQSLRVLVLTGEKVVPVLVNKFYSEYAITLINAYGQSECSDDTLHYHIPYSVKTISVPIGKPSNNTQVYVLNETCQLQPVGVFGELYISGDGLAMGYINRPELNSQRFIPNPFISQKMMFRTGDIVRWLPDGNIEYHGRTDEQVKIRGYRIELAEIEAHILQYGPISEVVVIARESSKGNAFLCAYFVGKERIISSELKGFLSNRLPEYMIPTFFIQIDKIPLTYNKKLDKKALPEPDENSLDEEYVTPRNDLEIKIAGIWQEVLGLDKIGVNHDFFKIGGNSILVIQLEVEMQNNGFDIEYTDIYTYRTIRELASHIENSCN